MNRAIQPRPFDPRKFALVLLVLLAFFIYTYTRVPPPQLHEWRGQTMGTWYTVKVVDHDLAITPEIYQSLHAEIDAALVEVNRQMSTYLPDSEISRFNRHDSITPFSVSDGFRDVLRAALDLAVASGNAFNPALDPLIELWGFGAAGPTRLPTTSQVQDVLARTASDGIAVLGNEFVKNNPRSQINLNAIAKGYGADVVDDLLAAHGFIDRFVEIGGDGVARGFNHKGRPWRVGIETPADSDAREPGRPILRILHLDRHGFATSGDYRNVHLDENGKPFSHLLDPRTGYPVQSSLASVTVVGPRCMEADGFATALYVMGVDEGLPWIEKQPGYEALFIVRRETPADFDIVMSSGFASLLSP
ncbi:MAG TPA: FAD:protein FMN transferase [Kiritimatiellia bacterium]|nr:FAD:protein FMN transferase [Kiritimatiellia bacterium]